MDRRPPARYFDNRCKSESSHDKPQKFCINCYNEIIIYNRNNYEYYWCLKCNHTKLFKNLYNIF